MEVSIRALFFTTYPEKVEKAIITCNDVFEYKRWAFDAFHKFGGYIVKFYHS